MGRSRRDTVSEVGGVPGSRVGGGVPLDPIQDFRPVCCAPCSFRRLSGRTRVRAGASQRGDRGSGATRERRWRNGGSRVTGASVLIAAAMNVAAGVVERSGERIQSNRSARFGIPIRAISLVAESFYARPVLA